MKLKLEIERKRKKEKKKLMPQNESDNKYLLSSVTVMVNLCQIYTNDLIGTSPLRINNLL